MCFELVLCHSCCRGRCYPGSWVAVQIVLHPRWGSAVYPATLFTKAPLAALLEAVKEAEAMLQGTGLSQP